MRRTAQPIGGKQNMNVKSVEKEAVRAKITVEVPRAEMEPAINKVYLKVR